MNNAMSKSEPKQKKKGTALNDFIGAKLIYIDNDIIILSKDGKSTIIDIERNQSDADTIVLRRHCLSLTRK